MSGNTSTAPAGVGNTIAGGGPCGACKFLRRKCVTDCIFAPYFDSEQGAAHFAAVHKVFGASNVSKLLSQIPTHKRLDAVVTICYEAQARIRDPVYGCVAHIFALQQQVVNLQAELSYLQAHLATLELPSPPPPQLPPPPPFSISDLSPSSSLPAALDLAALFEPPSWSILQQQQQQQRLIELRHIGVLGASGNLGTTTSEDSGGGDLQTLAQELLDRQCTTAKSSNKSSQPPK